MFSTLLVRCFAACLPNLAFTRFYDDLSWGIHFPLRSMLIGKIKFPIASEYTTFVFLSALSIFRSTSRRHLSELSDYQPKKGQAAFGRTINGKVEV